MWRAGLGRPGLSYVHPPVSVNSQVDGGTASTINCVNSANNTVASGSTGANGDGSAGATNLRPDTYTSRS